MSVKIIKKDSVLKIHKLGYLKCWFYFHMALFFFKDCSIQIF